MAAPDQPSDGPGSAPHFRSVFAVATAPVSSPRASIYSSDGGNSGSLGRREMSALAAGYFSPNAAATVALLRAETVLSDSNDEPEGGVMSLAERPLDFEV